jgi:hypothetical protein
MCFRSTHCSWLLVLRPVLPRIQCAALQKELGSTQQQLQRVEHLLRIADPEGWYKPKEGGSDAAAAAAAKAAAKAALEEERQRRAAALAAQRAQQSAAQVCVVVVVWGERPAWRRMMCESVAHIL